MSWVWGDRRLWIDETLNDMLALSDRYVAAVGHTHVFVWRRGDGAQVRRFAKFIRPECAWFVDAREELCLRTRGEVLVCRLASGEIEARAPAAEDPDLPVVAVDRSGYVISLHWAGGRTLRFAYPNEPLRRVSVAYSGGRVAIGRGSAIDIRDTQTGAVTHTLTGAGSGVLSPDGRWIAVGDLADRRIVIAAVDAWQAPDEATPRSAVEGLKFSPDGSRVLVVAGRTGWILGAEDGAPQVRVAPVSAGGTKEWMDPRAQWTADGAGIVGPATYHVARWDAATGAVTRCVALGPRERAEGFAADASGERVAIVGMTYPGGLMLVPGEEAVVLELATGAVVARIPLEDAYQESVELAPDGLRLALMHADEVRVVRLSDGAVERLAAAQWGGFNCDGVVMRGDEDGGRVVRVHGAVVTAELSLGPISAFAATPDGRWFATGRHDGTITVRAADFAVRCTLQAVDRPTALAISPDGRRLVAGGWDATVHAFDLPEAE